MTKTMILYLLIFLLGTLSCGKEQTDIPSTTGNDGYAEAQKLNQNFQIGSKWDRKAANPWTIYYENDSYLTNAFKSTVRVRTLKNIGTGFYLGQHHNQFIIATSAHVLDGIPFCSENFFTVYVKLSEINTELKCNKLIGIWKDIDMAIFSINVPSSINYLLWRINPLQFDWSNEVEKSQSLITLGYGEYQNDKKTITYETSEDCKVFSPSNYFKKIVNSNNSSIWSFAHGCDSSPGDSGSPVLSKNTGKVIGMTWATSDSKPQDFLDSEKLMQSLENNDPRIWKYLSYAVPAQTIREVWLNWIKDTRFSLQRRQVIYSILNN